MFRSRTVVVCHHSGPRAINVNTRQSCEHVFRIADHPRHIFEVKAENLPSVLSAHDVTKPVPMFRLPTLKLTDCTLHYLDEIRAAKSIVRNEGGIEGAVQLF